MSEDDVISFDRQRIEEFLLSSGAGRLAHPGGTLHEHLRRVADLLRAWGACQALQAAGLCHACYGTDGYGQPLLDVSERARLSAGRRARSWPAQPVHAGPAPAVGCRLAGLQ